MQEAKEMNRFTRIFKWAIFDPLKYVLHATRKTYASIGAQIINIAMAKEPHCGLTTAHRGAFLIRIDCNKNREDVKDGACR